jgi:hypothetical protein
MGEKRNAYRILVGKSEGKMTKCWWVGNSKMDLKGSRMGMVCTGLIWLRIGDHWRAFVNTIMNLRVP